MDEIHIPSEQLMEIKDKLRLINQTLVIVGLCIVFSTVGLGSLILLYPMRH
jgi:hypothetical protein